MGQLVTVSLNTKALTGVFQQLGRRAPIAVARALNRTGTSERTALARAIATDMGIKVGTAREAIAIQTASASQLAVRVVARGARIPLIDFKAKGPFPSRGRGRGVTYNLGAGGGRGRLDRGFIAQMGSGHRGVFVRRNASTGKSRGAWSQNLPIQEKFGPSIAHVFAKQVPLGDARRTDVLLKNLAHELEFALSKA